MIRAMSRILVGLGPIAMASGLFLACVGDEPGGGAGAGVDGGSMDASVDGGVPLDASPDGPLDCDPGAKFKAPQLVPGLPEDSVTPTLTRDELELVYADDGDFAGSAGALGPTRLMRATRSEKTMPFGAAELLSALSIGYDERAPAFGPDGLALFFQVADVDGGVTMWTSSRSSVRTGSFAAPVMMTDFGPALKTGGPHVTWDGTTLYFALAHTDDVNHLYRAQSANGFKTAAPIAELDTEEGESLPVATPDDLGLYYSRKSGARFDIWLARREARTAPYTRFELVSELNAGEVNLPGWLSPDGCRMYLTSTASGRFRVYYADRAR